MDLRKTLYSNIVLSGGSTLFKGKDNTGILVHLHSINDPASLFYLLSISFILSHQTGDVLSSINLSIEGSPRKEILCI